ncbi:MAG: cadherin-like beta sandwich domain-containing protein [Butyrivibrio sp.]|nr:cadherin-like beta sandwich domain-containing protein [Butyrivibrio sp.]
MLNFYMKNKIKISAALLMAALVIATPFLGFYRQTRAQAAASFEEVLEQFPKSYRAQLAALHEAHPDWTFEPYYVEEDWNDTIIANQLVLTRNLVPTGSSKMYLSGVDTDGKWYLTPTSWKSTSIAGSYDWAKNCWVSFDSGTWAQASEEAISYIMDPRNWLTEENVFMFEKLSYDKEVQTYDVVKIMMENTFMDCDYAKIKGDDGKSYTYGEVLIKAAEEYGVSPIHLCARIIQEQGTGKYNEDKKQYTVDGTLASGLATDDGGKTFRPAVKTDKTVYYNYFNIGAGGTGQEIINNGGREAMNAGWTSPYLAVMGGAKKLTNNYIAVGQDTLYFQKFNVVYHDTDGKLVAWKQYMQNLLAPVNEGYKARSGYESANLLDSSFTFRIPVYKSGFPDEVCKRPEPLTSTGNPNYKLKQLSATGTNVFGTKTELALTPTFNMDTGSYSIIVPYIISSVDIKAEAIASTSTVSGTGEHELEVGDNVFKIVCKSEYGTSKTYKLTVTRQKGSTLLKSIKPSSGKLTEDFVKDKLEYTMYVDNSVETLAFDYVTDSEIAKTVIRYKDITAECEGGNTGFMEIDEGDNVLYFDVYPSDEDRSAVTTYKVKIVRYSKTVFDKKNLQINGSYINGFAIGDTVASAAEKFAVENGSAVIMNADKKKKADTDLIGTGDYITVYDANGFEYHRYQIVLYGDVNGDGKVNLFDAAYLTKHRWIAPFLTGIKFEAANVYAQSADIDLYDMVIITNYMWNGGKIRQTR